ncbi:dTDP-4-dehydrorhamnose reductase [Desulfolutivibrio sulfoxidireducens]|uniref:dTDP-4-dehydrorhamnose reductase n=1 Tax=Desulfolutivibrio sulfoxidireducens TaxID=2773299 RepID=UPI00159D966F|nr:dTDP-4-dehydrorhamnose reductase [Desulfolutivibrio sulfoxidireducens]QLA16705.1 dTDP-4-dehydrorhamnose reductase [Desulfolutivibrio sulfoxidireducens]QLA19418.1 dTDP-4-dehydrorhamnose reductase [Desulfolutivibrio sulfoxidireducens]
MTATGKAIVLGGVTGLLGVPLTWALRDAGYDVLPTSRGTLDPFDRQALLQAITSFGADVLVNTVAYTAVDAAEDEPDEAGRLNRVLPGNLARVCLETGIGLVHYSTDFVFDGRKTSPYVETDPVAPQSVYGRTKLAGERAIRESGLENHLILRTAWLFGPGKTNFVEKILGFARTRDVLKIVHDQVGSPTFTVDLAAGTVALMKAGGRGLFHLVNSGRASWCELASEAVSTAGINCEVLPITSADYPQKARRPAYSVLDVGKFAEVAGYAPRPWVQALREYVYGLSSDEE